MWKMPDSSIENHKKPKWRVLSPKLTCTLYVTNPIPTMGFWQNLSVSHPFVSQICKQVLQLCLCLLFQELHLCGFTTNCQLILSMSATNPDSGFLDVPAFAAHHHSFMAGHISNQLFSSQYHFGEGDVKFGLIFSQGSLQVAKVKVTNGLWVQSNENTAKSWL